MSPRRREVGLTRRAALVTGASYGVGAATALALARAGCDVAVTATRADNLRDTLARLVETGVRAVPLVLDLRAQESIGEAFATTLTAFGRLDVLVNNASVNLRKAAAEVTPDDWNTVIETAPDAGASIRSPRRQLESLRKVDPEFSVVVLEDFLEALYVEVQHARAGGLERLQPFLKPEARVVFMSGYSDQAVGDLGTLEPGALFLQKPFTMDALLKTIRRALDAAPPIDGGSAE